VQIERLKLKSLGSFKDSGWFNLSQGMNFIVGQNNSGKSVLLNSIKDLIDNRYRSSDEHRTERLPQSSQDAFVTFSGDDLMGSFIQRGAYIFWPVQFGQSNTTGTAVYHASQFFSRQNHKFSVSRKPGNVLWINEGWPHPTAGSMTQVVMRDGEWSASDVGGPQADLPELLVRLWGTRVFLFNAQRYNIGNCGIAEPALLFSDARNLPAVLFRLNGDQGDKFLVLKQHMRDIFPTVQNLSVTVGDQQDVEIRVWPTLEQNHRELSVSLNQSGTGISQVLAILTIAMTFERGVIVIDEISSFLHPAASKALVRILESHYPNHQYIVSTHSSEVMSACSPSTVHLIRKGGYTSTISAVDPRSVSGLRKITRELGVSLTDVFAADRIIWVEGPTEEASFAYILEQTREQLPKHLATQAPQFTAVVSTGDFSKKRNRAELVFEIYSRLTEAAAPIANSTVFAFDAELLTAQEITDLKKRSANPVEFLPRRLYECFLLSPISIASVLNKQLDTDFNEGDIETALENLAATERYGAKGLWNGSLEDSAWLKAVDAANLLKDLFSQISENKLEYSKRIHSFEITKEALRLDPSRLTDLIDFVHQLTRLSLEETDMQTKP